MTATQPVSTCRNGNMQIYMIQKHHDQLAIFLVSSSITYFSKLLLLQTQTQREVRTNLNAILHDVKGKFMSLIISVAARIIQSLEYKLIFFFQFPSPQKNAMN